jgi:hypothetical protein
MPTSPLGGGAPDGYYIVSNQAPAAQITVSRSSVSAPAELAAPEQVRITTSDGTARAGVDYQAVDQVVTFGPGETSETVSIPILNTGKVGGAETVNVNMALPGTDGSSGGVETALLTIANRADVTPPTVRDVGVLTARKRTSISGITLTFDKPMDPASVQDLRQYGLTNVTNEYGTSGGIPTIRLRAATYDPATQTVTVTPAKPLQTATLYELDVGPTGLAATDPTSPPLNDADGNALGSASVTFAVGRNLSFRTSNGMGWAPNGQLTLHLQGGGTLELTSWSSGNDLTGFAPPFSRLSLIGTHPKQSVLSGAVGPDLAPITIVSATPFENQLKDRIDVQQIVIG